MADGESGGGNKLPSPVEIVKRGLESLSLGWLVNLGGEGKWLNNITGNEGSDLVNLVTNFRKFVKNPGRWVVAVVVGLALWVVNSISDAINDAVLLLEIPAEFAGDIIIGVGRPIGKLVVGGIGGLNQALIATLVGTGPLAPLALFGLWLAEMWVLYRLIAMTVPAAGPVVNRILGRA